MDALIHKDAARKGQPETVKAIIDIDGDEPTEEELRESIRRSMRQALAGQTRPAEEALAEIRREFAADADARQNN